MPDEQPIPKAEGPHDGGPAPANSQVPVTQEAELVNVLFIDLVGYTTLGTQKGSEVVEALFRLVRETTEFKKEQDRGRLRLLPSGDGTAIVFLRGSPAAPVRCALQIARAIKGNPEIRLRMGVNSGPIFWITDITGENVPAGGGINYAARAMSCGDDGHILLTQATAEVLLDLRGWDNYIHDIGEYEVKHGKVMHLYNLCQDDLGNPSVPPRNRVTKDVEKPPQPTKIAIETSSVPAGTLGTPYKFALRAANGTGAQTWTVQSGNLPPGIHLATATGMLAGTPSAAGDYTFTVEVTDSSAASAQASFPLSVAKVLSILTTSAPSATVGTAYKFALQANSTEALAWTVHSGELPPGMQLGISSGEFTGTPTVAGSYTLTVQATDSTAAPTRATLTLVVAKKQPRFRIPKYVLYGGAAALAVGLVALWGWLSPPVVEAQLHLQPLDTGGGSPITSPQLSADGTHLVFSRKDSDGKSDIYLADFDHGILTNANRNITGQKTTNDCIEPALSPDGKNLVLVLERRPPSSQEVARQRPHDETSGLYLIDLEQPALHTLPTKGYNPIWSPEGRRIVFGTENIGRPEDRDSLLNQLLSVDAATLGKTAFASAPNAYRGDAVQPSWSPHATRLAIWFTRNGHRDIGTLRADGADFVPITDDAYLDWNPVWSPDGYIYFSSDRGGDGLRLWRVRVDEDSGKVVGKLAEVHGSPLDPESISFSRDGRNVILLARQFTSDLYRAPFDADNGTVGQPVIVMSQGEATRPNISPDGGSVVYNSLRAKAADSIAVFSFEKAENTTVWSDGNMNRSPRWSPDGSEIAFWSNRNGNTQVWIMPANGSGRPVQISPTGGTDNYIYPVWSPTGQDLVFTRLGDSVSDSQTFIYNRGTGQAIALPGTESFIAWSWSPGADSLAGYMKRRDGGPAGIAIYSLKDKKLLALTNFGSDPVWCGDPHKNNLRILFFYKGEIFLVNAAQGYATTKVLSAESLKENVEVAPHGFSLSNDQRFLYFSRQVTRTQLYYVTIENGYASLM